MQGGLACLLAGGDAQGVSDGDGKKEVGGSCGLQSKGGRMTKKSELAEWKRVLSNEVGDEPRSQAWCRRALLRIYENQEQDEIRNKATTKRNGVGFTPADAPILSSFAAQLRGHNVTGGDFSRKQWEILYKLLPKYAGQLQRGVR